MIKSDIFVVNYAKRYFPLSNYQHLTLVFSIKSLYRSTAFFVPRLLA